MITQTDQLSCMDSLPAGLLACAAQDLWQLLPGPTLLQLPGEAAEQAPLLVSVLLHGNETGGWEALRRLLAGQPRLRRPLWLFVGNVAAARAGVRHLPGQRDFNRLWSPDDLPRPAFVGQLLELVRATPAWLAVDIHNNTGSNPHYACVTTTDPVTLAAARLFGPTVVLVHRPASILVRALAGTGPALVLECGQAGEERGVAHACRYLGRLLELPQLPVARPMDLDLYQTRVAVAVADDCSFAFTDPRDLAAGSPGPWLALLPEFERFNFDELEPGTLLATAGPAGTSLAQLLRVTDDAGQDVSDQYLELVAGEIYLRRRVVPSMFTCNMQAIRQDVLCYLMERIAP